MLQGSAENFREASRCTNAYQTEDGVWGPSARPQVASPDERSYADDCCLPHSFFTVSDSMPPMAFSKTVPLGAQLDIHAMSFAGADL